nr:PIN-like domain-containing protein [Fructobacillus fructosus]
MKQTINQEIKKLAVILEKGQHKRVLSLTNKYLDELTNEFGSETKDKLQSLYITKFDKLVELINPYIGEKPTQEEINQIQEKGKERYKYKLAPGFNDEQKGEARRYFDSLHYEQKYGDLLIWEDIKKKAKDTKIKKVIFVTDDGTSHEKNDLIFNGMGPRINMIDELCRESEAEFYILSNNNFVQYRNGTKVPSIKNELSTQSDRLNIYWDNKRKIDENKINILNITEEIRNLTFASMSSVISPSDATTRYNYLTSEKDSLIEKNKYLDSQNSYLKQMFETQYGIDIEDTLPDNEW